MALPAMATMTKPAKASEICRVAIAGSSAWTNQSETNAAKTAARANSPTARATGQRGGSTCMLSSACWFEPRRSDAGRVRTNKSSKIADTMSDNVFSCFEAGVCRKWARDGRTRAATDRTISTMMLRARSESSFWVPCLSPPTTKHNPRTNNKLARIDPMRAALTTSTKPARSANNAMNSSGKLPRADCSTPVAPGPNRSPSCSTERPTRDAQQGDRQRGTHEGQDSSTANKPGERRQDHGHDSPADDDDV